MRPARDRLRPVRLLSTVFLLTTALLSGVLGSDLAIAHSDQSSFPATSQVKSVLDGKGSWRSFRGNVHTIGGKPADCRSDKQLGSYDSMRTKGYFGEQRGVAASVAAGAQIVVLQYPNPQVAEDAVRLNGSYPRRCPRVTEWVCDDCDGISTTWRTRVSAAKVGAQSVAWRWRSVDNFKSNGYAVVARRGSTVVRVTVSRVRDVTGEDGWVYPKLIAKRIPLQLARIALRTAR